MSANQSLNVSAQTCAPLPILETSRALMGFVSLPALAEYERLERAADVLGHLASVGFLSASEGRDRNTLNDALDLVSVLMRIIRVRMEQKEDALATPAASSTKAAAVPDKFAQNVRNSLTNSRLDIARSLEFAADIIRGSEVETVPADTCASFLAMCGEALGGTCSDEWEFFERKR